MKTLEKRQDTVVSFCARETAALIKNHTFERKLLIKDARYMFRFPTRKLNSCKRIVEQVTGIDFNSPVFTYKPSTTYAYGQIDVFTFWGMTWIFDRDDKTFACINVLHAVTRKEARALFYRF